MTGCTLLIVNWNSWDLLCNCLEALSQQTYCDFKVIVWDNASNQAPPENISRFFHDLVLIQSKHNVGFARANNQLLKRV